MSTVLGADAGRVVCTGQGIVDVVMRIPAVPEAGGDVFASRHELAAGGGVNMMAAAARDGARVVYVGGHGTGPFGDLVRAALEAEGVEPLLAPDASGDTGFCIALVDDTTERTFISTSGVEARTSLEDLRMVDLWPGDVVSVSGYSFVHDVKGAALTRWLPEIPTACTVVVDPSPVIGDLGDDAVSALLERADVWTTNDREARILLARRDQGEACPRAGASDGTADALVALAVRLVGAIDRTVILRAGSAGAVLAEPGGSVTVLPPMRVRAVDSNGAGDAHTGVLCAQLAAGADLGAAAERAGVAAALAVTREGPATSPTAAEIDTALSRHRGARVGPTPQ